MPGQFGSEVPTHGNTKAGCPSLAPAGHTQCRPGMLPSDRPHQSRRASLGREQSRRSGTSRPREPGGLICCSGSRCSPSSGWTEAQPSARADSESPTALPARRRESYPPRSVNPQTPAATFTDFPVSWQPQTERWAVERSQKTQRSPPPLTPGKAAHPT